MANTSNVGGCLAPLCAVLRCDRTACDGSLHGPYMFERGRTASDLPALIKHRCPTTIGPTRQAASGGILFPGAHIAHRFHIGLFRCLSPQGYQGHDVFGHDIAKLRSPVVRARKDPMGDLLAVRDSLILKP